VRGAPRNERPYREHSLERIEGEPTREELLHVCSVLHSWGFDEVIGGPGIFY